MPKVIDSIAVCGNCLQVHANGEYEPYEGDPVPLSTYELPEGAHFALGGEELGFSWRKCDGCNNLAGDRYSLNVIQ